MSTMSGLIGEKNAWPHLGPFQADFSMDQKNAKTYEVLPIFLGKPMGPIQPLWGSRSWMGRCERCGVVVILETSQQSHCNIYAVLDACGAACTGAMLSYVNKLILLTPVTSPLVCHTCLTLLCTLGQL